MNDQNRAMRFNLDFKLLGITNTVGHRFNEFMGDRKFYSLIRLSLSPEYWGSKTKNENF